MKHLLLASVCLFTSALVQAQSKCDDTVDMADSLDFHAMHVECTQDPVTLYDPESKSNFLSKKSKVVTAYADQAQASGELTPTTKAAAVMSARVASVTEVAQSNAGVTFNIREAFTLTGGPQSALNGLYVQMARYCPAGWSKKQEWVVAADAGYLLHYQFTCSEQ